MSQTATQWVYDRLRGLLVHGQIVAGTRLVESQWAAHLDTNRAAIREASMVLAHEGLLERGAKGGYFVPRYDADRLAQLLAVRQVLELGAMDLIEADPPDPDALDPLDAVCDQMERLIAEGYAMGFAEADRRFHLRLVELAHNPHLLRVYHSAPLPLMAPTEMEPERLREQMRLTLDEHRAVVAQLRDGDYAAARTFLRDHLTLQHQPAAHLRSENLP